MHLGDCLLQSAEVLPFSSVCPGLAHKERLQLMEREKGHDFSVGNVKVQIVLVELT